MAKKKANVARKNVKEVSDATRHFYLNDISLWDCSFKRDAEFQYDKHTSKTCIIQTFQNLRPEFVEVEVKDEEEDQIMLRVLVKLGIRMIESSQAEEETPDPIYTLETSFLAEYFVLAPPSEDTFQHFVEFNVVHNVWPFWRQHVFQTLKQASLPVPVVPLFAGQSKYRRKRTNVKRVIATGDQDHEPQAY